MFLAYGWYNVWLDTLLLGLIPLAIFVTPFVAVGKFLILDRLLNLRLYSVGIELFRILKQLGG